MGSRASCSPIMEQMKAAEGVTEVLKRTCQMEWVQRCNNIHNRAEEIVLHEMAYFITVSQNEYDKHNLGSDKFCCRYVNLEVVFSVFNRRNPVNLFKFTAKIRRIVKAALF